MPELPEVETLKRYLEISLINKSISNVVKRRANIRYELSPSLTEDITGHHIVSLDRRAKYLIVELSNNYVIIVHLGMSGRFTVKDKFYLPEKHDHLIFQLNDYSQLVFTDPRRFGMVYYFPKAQLFETPILKRLGPEPLSDEFTAEYLYKKLRLKKTSIKTAIMDSKLVVGVGNIYASESLFRACISPVKYCFQLTDKELIKLTKAIQQVLQEAIEMGGTTLKDFVNGDGQPGYFKQKLFVYDRENLSCLKCKNGKIIKINQAGRSSFYCPECQS